MQCIKHMLQLNVLFEKIIKKTKLYITSGGNPLF